MRHSSEEKLEKSYADNFVHSVHVCMYVCAIAGLLPLSLEVIREQK